MNNNSVKEENSITLSDILRVIWKNIILICVITVIATVGCIIYVFGFVTPTYKATSDIIVAVESKDESTTVDYTNTLKVVSTVGNELVKSDYVIDKVYLKHKDIAQDEAQAKNIIKNNISSSVSTTSYVVTISYTDTNKTRATEVVNDIATALNEYAAIDEAIKSFKLKTSTMNKATGDAQYNSPNKKLYIIVALLGGLVLSLVVVFIKEFMSSKFKTKDEIEQLLGKDIIGVLPNVVKGKAHEELVPAPKTIQEFEPYNKLLSAIEYYNIDNPYKVIMFTSTCEDELKTTTIFKLAHTLVNNEKKVLLLDLDVRKPMLHKYFNQTKKDGVVDFLKGDLKIEEIIKHTDCGVDLITAGENIINPIVLLKNEKLKDLISELKTKYDYVLVDTPPAAGITDATLVSAFTDGVVYNIALNQAKKKIAKETIKQLEAAGAKIIGINITKVQMKRSDYYYQYYNYNYGNETKVSESESE